MTDETIARIMVVTVLLTVVLLARWYARRIPDWGPLPETPLLREADGAAIVPVSLLLHRRLLGSTSNGISPRLWITPTGLRFKVFRLDEKPFTDFRRVDAYPALLAGGVRLIFVGHGRWLHALVTDRAAARAVLRLLPRDLPLSPAAAALRDAR